MELCISFTHDQQSRNEFEGDASRMRLRGHQGEVNIHKADILLLTFCLTPDTSRLC